MNEMEGDPELDMVSGSRFLSDDSDYPAPISRRTGIHIFAFVVSRIVRQRVSDPTSGFRLYNRRAIAVFARDYPHDYPEVEAILVLHFHRLKCSRSRCACTCVRAGSRRSPRQVGVLHAQGAARDLRGPVPRAAGPEPGGAAPVAAEHGI